ncbi:MAG: carbohydrate ABC transporter permease [Clostridia bacterium]|nr:carbohydrate ABC transporter permease [Clostridia bacterium]
MKISKAEKIGNVILTVFMLVIAFVCLYPLIYVFSASISSVEDVLKGTVVLLPKNVTFAAYKKVFENPMIGTGYLNAIYYTVVGTLIQLFVTTLGAYPLSKPRLKGRRIINFMVVFSMWFSGGMIPTYLTLVDYGMVNNRWGILLGFACTAYNVIILRTFFTSVPMELEEAARIDGAGHWRTLWQIYLPLSKAAYATLALMYGIGRWNGYVWAMILLNKEELQPLQVILKKIIVDTTFGGATGGSGADSVVNYSEQMIVYAVIVVSTLPMLVAYPFVQKYFKKGMMLGSVKG